MENRTQGLLRRIAWRQRAASLGARFQFFLLVLAAAYAVLLLCSRLLGVIPNWFAPVNLLTIAAAALALAVAFYWRPAPAQTARFLDTRMETNDLFLTSVLIGTSAGLYKPLVLRMAEERAAAIEPRRVVPFNWAAGTRNTILVLAVLLAGALFLPQLDPFGKEEQRRRVDERRKQLENSRKATALRVALLRKKEPDAKLSEEVRKATEELRQTFNTMKRPDKQGNLKRLSQDQAQLGKLWRTASEKRLKDALRQTGERQQFGGRGGQKAAQWRQQLRKGDASGTKEELAALKELAQQLARTSDAAERRKLAAQLKERLEQLSDAVGGEMSADSLDAALQRALEQLAMAEMGGLSPEALEALQESLDLSEFEMEELAQAVRDLKALEDALRTLQLAKRLNDMELLDGEPCSACDAMADYANLYAQLMAGRCSKCGGQLGPGGICPGCGGGKGGGGRGIGQGMRGAGIGIGGLAPEDPGAESAFKTEKSKSALTAGKMLLTMKGRGVSEPGQAVVDYRQYMEEIKQGVSEAMLHEQIPPAYHDAVRKYFDSIGESHEAEGAE